MGGLQFCHLLGFKVINFDWFILRQLFAAAYTRRLEFIRVDYHRLSCSCWRLWCRSRIFLELQVFELFAWKLWLFFVLFNLLWQFLHLLVFSRFICFCLPQFFLQYLYLLLHLYHFLRILWFGIIDGLLLSPDLRWQIIHLLPQLRDSFVRLLLFNLILPDNISELILFFFCFNLVLIHLFSPFGLCPELVISLT